VGADEPSAGLREVTSEAELRELLGAPAPHAARKARTALHALDREWLAHSPLCLIATSASDGSCDVSPKGDPPGFVKVLGDRTIAIPDRPGNKRIDGFRNVLSNPHVGLIHLLPGRGDTLRINGRARIVREAPFLGEMTVKQSRPLLALVVEIEDALPSRARLSKALERQDDPLEVLEEHYGPSYAEKLYRW
jgi:PPOX class probable FMN-dependent enzyme